MGTRLPGVFARNATLAPPNKTLFLRARLYLSTNPIAMRLLGRKSKASLKASASAQAPSPPPPLPSVLPPLLHTRTEPYKGSGSTVLSADGSNDNDHLEPPLRIHALFSRSSSLNDVASAQSNPSTGAELRGMVDPRLGGTLGRRPGGKGFMGREEEALVLSARRRRGADEGNSPKVRSDARSYQPKQPGLGSDRDEVKVIQTRRRRAYTGGSDGSALSKEIGAATSIPLPVPPLISTGPRKIPVLPVALPRAPTPPPSTPPKPVLVALPSPTLDRQPHLPPSILTKISRSVSEPANALALSFASPPPEASPAWKAAHDIVVSRGLSLKSTTTPSPSSLYNPHTSSGLNTDPLLVSRPLAQRKKWDPLAVFEASSPAQNQVWLGPVSPGFDSSVFATPPISPTLASSELAEDHDDPNLSYPTSFLPPLVLSRTLPLLDNGPKITRVPSPYLRSTANSVVSSPTADKQFIPDNNAASEERFAAGLKSAMKNSLFALNLRRMADDVSSP